MVKKHAIRYTREEADYVYRNAGKVPVSVMAEQIKKSVQSIRDFANRHQIGLRVPTEVMKKHWSEFDKRLKQRIENVPE